jgi:hypothetical protein
MLLLYAIAEILVSNLVRLIFYYSTLNLGSNSGVICTCLKSPTKLATKIQSGKIAKQIDSKRSDWVRLQDTG